jgi:hypothetical protein
MAEGGHRQHRLPIRLPKQYGLPHPVVRVEPISVTPGVYSGVEPLYADGQVLMHTSSDIPMPEPFCPSGFICVQTNHSYHSQPTRRM